ncbi:MAG: transposase, partial [Candidatus Heimdallarchaeota archaeon]|nr:transposase [Candidatus Heimdallarchaeota archaeon]
KNDKADAVRIAQVAQLDDFIKTTYIPTKDEFALRELLRQRSKIVREYVRMKNASRKIFASVGFTYKFDFKKEWEMDLIQTFLESEGTIGDAVRHHENQYFVKKNKKQYINLAEIQHGSRIQGKCTFIIRNDGTNRSKFRNGRSGFIEEN